MNFYLQTKVWVSERDGESQKLHDLGIESGGDKLTTDDIVIDIMQIRYFYPTSMNRENDSTYIKMKGSKSENLIIAVPFADFANTFFLCIKDF